MASSYDKPCKELDLCYELIEKYDLTGQYGPCFEGHRSLAEQGHDMAIEKCRSL